MRLALRDFNKNKVFNRNCMWLQLSQILKEFTEGNARKLAFIFPRDVPKIRKTRVVSRVGIHLVHSAIKIVKVISTINNTILNLLL